MDDLAKQLSSLLESPEGAELIRALGGLSGDGAGPAGPEGPPPPPPPDPLAGVSKKELDVILKISGILKSGREDDRTRLLLALRPLLSPARRGRVDRAVKLLKALEILPVLRESGLDLF